MSTYNFLGLVNDVCQQTNDTELTSSNFTTELGVYSAYKDAVNSALRQINRQEYEWPFNHETQEDVLTAGEARWFLPADAKTVDWDTFRIKRDDTLGNTTTRLANAAYEEYVRHYIDDEYNSTDTGIRGLPRMVFRTLSQEYALNPVPDAAYTVAYEYWKHQVDLINYDDVPAVPEEFRYVILAGAMYHAELFRGDIEAADRHEQKFREGIQDMQRLYIKTDNHIRHTMTPKRRAYDGYIDI